MYFTQITVNKPELGQAIDHLRRTSQGKSGGDHIQVHWDVLRVETKIIIIKSPGVPRTGSPIRDDSFIFPFFYYSFLEGQEFSLNHREIPDNVLRWKHRGAERPIWHRKGKSGRSNWNPCNWPTGLSILFGLRPAPLIMCTTIGRVEWNLKGRRHGAGAKIIGKRAPSTTTFITIYSQEKKKCIYISCSRNEQKWET